MQKNNDDDSLRRPEDHKYLLDLQKRHQEAEANGSAPLRYLMFWGHTTKKNETHATASCFSQWFPSPFVVDGRIFHTAEQWMMAQKALLFASEKDSEEQQNNNKKVFEEIMLTTNPSVVKRFGRMVEGFDESRWESHRFEIVKKGNYHKFTQNTELKEFLLNTATKYDVIVEASPVDAIWGIGLAASSDDAFNPCLWKGTNLLGFALTELRDELLLEEKSAIGDAASKKDNRNPKQ